MQLAVLNVVTSECIRQCVRKLCTLFASWFRTCAMASRCVLEVKRYAFSPCNPLLAVLPWTLRLKLRLERISIFGSLFAFYAPGGTTVCTLPVFDGNQ